MEFGFRRNVLIILPINTPNVSQLTNNQSKQTKRPKGMSLFHLVTTPTAFPRIQQTSCTDGAASAFFQRGIQPILKQFPVRLTQLSPCSARTALSTQSSSNSEQFHRTGFEGQDLTKAVPQDASVL